MAAKNLKLQLPPDTAIDAQVALSRDLQLAVTFDIRSDTLHHTRWTDCRRLPLITVMCHVGMC